MSEGEATAVRSEGIQLRSRIVPPLDVGSRMQRNWGRGKDQAEVGALTDIPQAEETGFVTARGGLEVRMELPFAKAVRAGGIPKAPLQRARTEPQPIHLSRGEVSSSLSPLDTDRGAATNGARVNRANEGGARRGPPFRGRLGSADQQEGDGESQGTDFTNRRIYRGVITAPPRFDGSNPRQWLMQIGHYYEAMGLSDIEKVTDVPAFLTGKALAYWCSLVTHAQHLIPTTWDEFNEVILARFSGQTVGSTIARLRQIRYEGDFEEVADKFAEVLETGEHPPQDTVRDLFLSRFPFEMIKAALEADLETWVDVREFLRRNRGQKQEKAMRWYDYAPPEYRREVERNTEVQREGWVEAATNKDGTQLIHRTGEDKRRQNSDREKGQYRHEGRMGPSREHNSRGQQQSAGQQQDNRGNNSREIRCYKCNGSGHISRNCPNARLEARRDGQRCHRCGGLGHWASACPTPPSNENRQRYGQTKREETSTGQRGNGQA